MKYGVAIGDWANDPQRWLWPILSSLSKPLTAYLPIYLERSTVAADAHWRRAFVKLAGEVQTQSGAMDYGRLAIDDIETFAHFSEVCNGNPHWSAIVTASEVDDGTALCALELLWRNWPLLNQRVIQWQPLAPVFRELDLDLEWAIALGCYPIEAVSVAMTASSEIYDQLRAAAERHADRGGVRETWDLNLIRYFDPREDRLSWVVSEIEQP